MRSYIYFFKNQIENLKSNFIFFIQFIIYIFVK
jgi:hypothetical protein